MNKKILIIDDEEAICHFLSRLFSLLNYDCISVNDGEQTIDILKRERFDLILLDIRIPKINGYEIYNKLDEDSKKKVVIFSGDVLSPELFSFVKDNNIKLLKKPATFEEIKELLDNL